MNGMQWPNFDLDFMVVPCEFLSILSKVHLFFPWNLKMAILLNGDPFYTPED